MGDVTHVTESCHTGEWVISHIWMSRITDMNESCHTCAASDHFETYCTFQSVLSQLPLPNKICIKKHKKQNTQLTTAYLKPSFSTTQCVAACCSVLQRVAVCCSVLQCVAACAMQNAGRETVFCVAIEDAQFSRMAFQHDCCLKTCIEIYYILTQFYMHTLTYAHICECI